MTEPDPTRTPPTVIGAVAAGTVVVPFLIVYSFLFIVRGAFVEVDQPDITGSRSGELVAGLVALCYLIFVLWGMGRLLSGWDRWVFCAGQVVTAAVALDLLLDASSGEPQVPAVVLGASLLAVVLACLRPSWQWVQTDGGQRLPAAGPDSATPDRLATEGSAAGGSAGGSAAGGSPGGVEEHTVGGPS